MRTTHPLRTCWSLPPWACRRRRAARSTSATRPRRSRTASTRSCSSTARRQSAACALELAQELCRAATENTPFDLGSALARLHQIDEDVRLGPSTGSIVSAAVARGIPYRRLTSGSLVQFGWGSEQRRIQAAEVDRTRGDRRSHRPGQGTDQATARRRRRAGPAGPTGGGRRRRLGRGQRDRRPRRWSSRRTATRARASRSTSRRSEAADGRLRLGRRVQRRRDGRELPSGLRLPPARGGRTSSPQPAATRRK